MCLFVILIDRDAQLIRIDGQPILRSQEFPRPTDRFLLEVIAEREIPQHFKKGVVNRRAANVIDVAGPHALLARRRAGKVELDFAQEVVLELVHPRRSEQHRGVPGRYQYIAGTTRMAFGCKEFEVFFA